MLQRLKINKGPKFYAIILVDPSIITHGNEIDYYRDNAARGKGTMKCEFNEMFSNANSNLTRNNQCEIQMTDVPRSFIQSIHVVPGTVITDRVKELSRYYGIPIVENNSLFADDLIQQYHGANL
jgi:hypothetical protein